VTHPLLEALEPLADALGATLVGVDDVEPGDVVLRWEGQAVGGFRLPGLHGVLERLVANAEREVGVPVAAMTREQKQSVVHRLDEGGAFTLRRGVEDVADLLGLSRFTIYNYLNAVRERA
jgi:hypothetical protein